MRFLETVAVQEKDAESKDSGFRISIYNKFCFDVVMQ